MSSPYEWIRHDQPKSQPNWIVFCVLDKRKRAKMEKKKYMEMNADTKTIKETSQNIRCGKPARRHWFLFLFFSWLIFFHFPFTLWYAYIYLFSNIIMQQFLSSLSLIQFFFLPKAWCSEQAQIPYVQYSVPYRTLITLALYYIRTAQIQANQLWLHRAKWNYNSYSEHAFSSSKRFYLGDTI